MTSKGKLNSTSAADIGLIRMCGGTVFWRGRANRKIETYDCHLVSRLFIPPDSRLRAMRLPIGIYRNRIISEISR